MITCCYCKKTIANKPKKRKDLWQVRCESCGGVKLLARAPERDVMQEYIAFYQQRSGIVGRVLERAKDLLSMRSPN